MELESAYNSEERHNYNHFVIDFDKSELRLILEDIVKCIKVENREMSMEEYNIIQGIKDIVE